MGINYGAEKVRFPAPVPVGSRAARPRRGDRRQGGAGRRAGDDPGDDRARRRRETGRDRRHGLPVPVVTPAPTSGLDAFRLDGKVAIVTGAGRGIGAADRPHVRGGGCRRRARGAHEGTARRGRRRCPRPRPAGARDPARRQRQRRGRRHRRADDRRVRPARHRRQQRGRHDAAAVPRHEPRLPRAVVPLQRHDRVRAQQGRDAALLDAGDGRDRQHLLRDRPPARPRVRRLRHGQGCAQRT